MATSFTVYFSSEDTTKGTVVPGPTVSRSGANNTITFSNGVQVNVSNTSLSVGYTIGTATPADGYTILKWQYSTSSSGPWTDISNDPNNPTNTHFDGTYYIRAVFGTLSQTVTLTDNHDYIVMTNSSATATLSGTVLTVNTPNKIDVIDLGAGTRDDGPCVMLVSSNGPSYVGSA